MSERRGSYNQSIESLIEEVKSYKEPVEQTLLDAKTQREKERIEKGETTHPDPENSRARNKSRQVKTISGKTRGEPPKHKQ